MKILNKTHTPLSYYISKSLHNYNPIIDGIFVDCDEGVAVACDEFQLIKMPLVELTGSIPSVLPEGFIPFTKGVLPTERVLDAIKAAKDGYVGIFKKGNIIALVSRSIIRNLVSVIFTNEILGTYPDYTKFIPDKSDEVTISVISLSLMVLNPLVMTLKALKCEAARIQLHRSLDSVRVDIPYDDGQYVVIALMPYKLNI